MSSEHSRRFFLRRASRESLGALAAVASAGLAVLAPNDTLRRVAAGTAMGVGVVAVAENHLPEDKKLSRREAAQIYSISITTSVGAALTLAPK